MKFSMPDPDLIKKLNFSSPALWLATWFGCGLMRPAPGTWGTLGGLPIGLILMALGGYWGLLIGIAFIIPIGLWAAKEFEVMAGEHDSGLIVIDEVAGIWIALLAVVHAPLYYIVLAFVLFRFFDILKPWPVSFLDKKIPGAFGVMLDDVAAGLYAAGTLWIFDGVRHAYFAG